MFNILGAEALQNAHFGSGTGPLLLDGLSCTGTEANLLSCYHRGIGVTGYNCTTSDTAGVRCQGMVIFVFVCACTLAPRLIAIQILIASKLLR